MTDIDRKADAFRRIDDGENIGVNPSTEPSIGAIIERRLSRRDALLGLGAGTAVATLAKAGLAAETAMTPPARKSSSATTATSSASCRCPRAPLAAITGCSSSITSTRSPT